MEALPNERYRKQIPIGKNYWVNRPCRIVTWINIPWQRSAPDVPDLPALPSLMGCYHLVKPPGRASCRGRGNASRIRRGKMSREDITTAHGRDKKGTGSAIQTVNSSTMRPRRRACPLLSQTTSNIVPRKGDRHHRSTACSGTNRTHRWSQSPFRYRQPCAVVIFSRPIRWSDSWPLVRPQSTRRAAHALRLPAIRRWMFPPDLLPAL